MTRCLCEINRRGFLLASCSAGATVLEPGLRGTDTPDPWSKKELMEPQELATLLNGHGTVPHIYCVAFPLPFIGESTFLALFLQGRPARPRG